MVNMQLYSGGMASWSECDFVNDWQCKCTT